VADPVVIHFDTELLSLDLTGGPILLPLASDPANLLGDSTEGYGWVLSSISISLSSQRDPAGPSSPGEACAFLEFGVESGGGGCEGPLPPIDPNALHGKQFYVQSFFDVFFDITVTDVDSRAGRDYGGMLDGASITLTDNNDPLNPMQTNYNAIFDKNAPNFGLVPPPIGASPYVGHFKIEIPLGGDLNGNGVDDEIAFTLAEHTVGGNRTFIILPDGTVLDTFDSSAYLEGAIRDETTDPPFSFTLTGPTTASSKLTNPIVQRIPEPSTILLLCIGLGAVVMSARKRVKK
jgi:hypothetical protein